MDGEKGQAPKARKDKKKNTETGLLMGQNMNIFSQLSATYLQSKPSATEDEAKFVSSTQIIEYHDPNINRLIALLRKKAQVTKAKAAVQLREQIAKMNEENMEEFIQTFSHLFMEVIINEQSKQVIDEFLAMINFILTSFKKIAIREIATIFGPFLVINRANNINQIKIYSMLFNGTEEQVQEKAIILLLNKNVLKKFLIFARVIVECEESHKIGQQNFQRNCSSLLKVIKEFIRNFSNLPDKKEELTHNFGRFILEISDIVSGNYAQQYFKVGGKAKGSFLELYQTFISESCKHPEWRIDWQSYAKTICQNYLDKDSMVQQTLWRYCNKQFIKSSLELQASVKEQGKQKDKYWILHKYLPKPDEKLLLAIKLGGQALYKELPGYCTVFPYTNFQQKSETHKSLINKITYIRKLMQAILEQEDENEVRVDCYFQLTTYFITTMRKCLENGYELEEKKLQEVRSLLGKTEKQLINNIQDRFYQNPPTSRNSFTYTVPTVFCKLLADLEPNFDFIFDAKSTFDLYCPLKNEKLTAFVTTVYDKIYENCQKDPMLTVQYLENFPNKSIILDMSDKNTRVEETAKIFLLSKESENPENWFKPEWDIHKSLIIFDPRISMKDLKNFEQTNSYTFKPSNRGSIEQSIYMKQSHDAHRFAFFIHSLEDEDHVTLVPLMLPYVKDVLLQRSLDNKINFLNCILALQEKSVDLLAKKQWVVGETSILRLRAIYDVLVEGLKGLDLQTIPTTPTPINTQTLNKFLQTYCQFILSIYNYKLQTQSQQLLKQLPKLLHNTYLCNQIFESVREAIKIGFHTAARTGQKDIIQGEDQDKQRKNRLVRVFGFVRKLVWFGVNQKMEDCYVVLVQDVLESGDWKFAEYRPDLWMLLEAIIQNVSSSTLSKISLNLLQTFTSTPEFCSLLLCIQQVLPLQRHASTKKFLQQLQSQFLKQCRNRDNHHKNIQIVKTMIKWAITINSSMLLVYGIRNLLKNFMKNYQLISQEVLGEYVGACLGDLVGGMGGGGGFQRRGIVLVNVCQELPLIDLPNIHHIYQSILQILEQENSGIRNLGYMAVLASMWETSLGIDKLTPEKTTELQTKFIASCKECVKPNSQQSTNFARFFALTFLNSFLQLKPKQSFNEQWDFLLKNLILLPVQQGSLLHGPLQSARYKAISKVFSTCSTDLKNQLIIEIPEEILKEIKFYKEVLDQIEEGEDSEATSTQHYENIVNMFIEFAEVLVRITNNLSKNTRPDERLVLELLQCPFPGIKKTSFMLLKQMYNMRFVEKMPPAILLSYLKLDPEIVRKKLQPTTANIISGYLYSWQALINRRGAIQQPSEDESSISMSLEDYLQSEQLHEPFLKNIFEVFETHLEYSKNEQDFEISPEELVEMDSIVSIEDDSNLASKVFRLSVRTLFMFVENFPLFLRDFVDKNKKFRVVCERLLRNVVSDAIFKEEIARIQIREHEWKAAGNFQIYVVPKNKEIYAEYTHDVIRIGLRLLMKSNYPLTPISIEFGEGLKIEDGSRWALMLQTQLHSRNNTIINGILLWKDNIDKKLAGVEECSICFDIVNGNGQLPKKGCKTCKKKFHSVCIMKWFSKSNKSECPLCKSQFL